MAGSGRAIGLVLLALGPVLAAAYAGAGLVAIRMAVRAQVAGPGWAGAPIAPGAMTALGADTWQVTWWTALLAGLVALAYVVIGVLLRRRARGRKALLVLSGVLIIPYALGFFVALLNPVKMMAGFYDKPDFAAGLPGWQSATPLILLAAALAQAVALAMVTAQSRRVTEPASSADRSSPPP
ncbi:hypothetical protein SAMN05444920_105343 [Nonomuraea solani]|uniref:Uncharacterized protein n=1 Tax=Nonomuraea solani TaxID=1144553 RepID=A0A1H6DI17_9ACTN|nr:hypothetical protein [Nonomuraea solani]SEG84295.1 hypothetical protein SAMN05444920_105343 [Nonomuraea solani]